MKNPKLKLEKKSFGVVSKKYETFRDNLTNEVKDLYTENYKILLRVERPK